MTTASTSRTRRRAALAAAALSALALSGCQLNSPATTTFRYAPADGVQVDGTGFDVRDLLVVSHGNGAPAVISGSVINQTGEELAVSVTAAGTSLTPEITVSGNSAVRLDGTAPDGTPGEPLALPTLDSPAGQSIEIRLSAAGETLTANAPVLLPQGPYERFADDAGGTVEPHSVEDGDH